MNEPRARTLEAVEPEAAKEILVAVHARGGAVAEAVDEELDRFYGPADDAEATAAEVLDTLEAVEIEDLWGRSGKRPDGTYVEPADAVYALLREKIEPYIGRIEDHLKGEEPRKADGVLRGVALGLYRFGTQSSTTFRDWAQNDPVLVLEEVLRRWKENRGGGEARRETEAWLSENLPQWEWVAPES